MKINRLQDSIILSDLPDTLPCHWKFPPPDTYSGDWNDSDWVHYAARFNMEFADES